MSKNQLTIEEFKEALPPSIKKAVNPATLAHINAVISDPEVAESFRENLLSFTRVIKEGKFKVTSYINAVRYVSYKLMGKSNQKSYEMTFPDKYLRLVARGCAEKDIAAYVCAYNKGKLVNLIYEQTLVPSYILNAHLYQDALNVQADLMHHARSETVRSNAADSIMTQLKQPETTKVELDIGLRDDGSLQALRDSSMTLVNQQRAMIAAGHLTADQVAKSVIVPVTDVTPDP